MATYLLDTNHLSPLVTLSHPLRRRVLTQQESGDTFATCVPVVTEALFGLRLLPRVTQNLQEWERLKVTFRCHLPDLQDAEQAAELQAMLRQRGWQLETVDALRLAALEFMRQVMYGYDPTTARLQRVLTTAEWPTDLEDLQ